MGAVNTTYTFTATDTITSTKMNNIIDQTTITDEAIIGTTLEVASGKLKVRAQGITSNEMATGSVTSNAILDGTIVNADINASAAIAGTKISPAFGTQNISNTGGNLSISNTGSCVAQTTSGTVTGQLYSSSASSSVAVGSVSNNPLVVFTNNAERMRITAAGNVGVGTTNPENKFEVNNYIAAKSSTNTQVAKVEAQADNYWSGPTHTGTSIIQGGSATTGTNCGLSNANLGVLSFQNGSAGLIATNGASPVVFGTTSSERMRITAAGNVGIGKTNPSTILDVNGTVTATAFAGPLTGNASTATTAASCSGNSATATNLSTNRTNWSTNGTISATVGQLAWKNFGNNHTIFDASQGTTPSGTSCNQFNADVGWSGGLPTLMGWNGTNTHGVRVDSAKFADSATNATNATTASTVSNGAITAVKLNGAQSGDAPIFGVRAWVNFNGTSGSTAIRQAGNVSSVTRNALGRYTITFSTAMQDTNYAIVGFARDADNSGGNYFVSALSGDTKTTTQVQIEVNSTGGTVDSPEVNLMIIR